MSCLNTNLSSCEAHVSMPPAPVLQRAMMAAGWRERKDLAGRVINQKDVGVVCL
jgi:hypothetical protein